ncbi:hypothetical protein TNCV_2544011 [Trichonephila clavipes]|nr:hypothetical protein TNCV_2544011 [Trichonephila clavipes]
MESIPNKWHCHQEGQSRSLQSIDNSTGSLLGIKRSRLRRATVPQFACDLAAASGRRFFRCPVPSYLAQIRLYALLPVWCVPLISSSRNDGLSPGEKMELAFIPLMKQKSIDLVPKESLSVVAHC